MYGLEKSDTLIVPRKPTNKGHNGAAEPVEESDVTKGNTQLQNMVRTQSRVAVSQAQERIRGAISRNKEGKLTALLHHLNIEVLRAGFFNLKKQAAVGLDEVSWDQYAQDLEGNLKRLHERVHSGAYRALPSRRVYIPKADGKERPLGIAALEDKIVQAALVSILTPIYEAEFLGFSYGFRPGRGQHDALDAAAYAVKNRHIWWVLDADIRSFFDTISHEWLVRFLEHRIGDKRVIRLICKWLRVGILEDGQQIKAQKGTPQGAVISPLLANIYLHYVYDLWAHAWRRHHARGEVIIVRYADDSIVGFQYRPEAERFVASLKERLAKFGLNLHPDKTRLMEFGSFAAERRKRRGAGKPETFDFLGFTHICSTKRNGKGFQLHRKTMCKRKWSKLREIKQKLRGMMHSSTDEQGRWLRSVLLGYYAYYAVPTNMQALRAMRHLIKIRWFLTLRRRSQKDRLSWRRMNALALRYLPQPKILHPWPDRRFLVNNPR